MVALVSKRVRTGDFGTGSNKSVIDSCQSGYVIYYSLIFNVYKQSVK